MSNSSGSKNSVIIYDGNPILWSPFIARYHIDLTIRGLSYIMNDEEITCTIKEPPPPVYQLANNDGWPPEDATSREQRITYNISIGQSYASAHKIWEEQCFKVYSDFETAIYILLERVSSQISSEVFRLLTTQQFANSRERYNAVWSMIFKRFGPHNQSHIRNLLTKCDPYTEGWLVVLDKFDSAIKTLRNIPYCNSKTGLAIHDEEGKPITFEPANEDLLGYLKRHLLKAPPGTPLSRVQEKITKMTNISFEEVARDIRNIFAGSTQHIPEEPAKRNQPTTTATTTTTTATNVLKTAVGSDVNSTKPLPPAMTMPIVAQQPLNSSSSSIPATTSTTADKPTSQGPVLRDATIIAQGQQNPIVEQSVPALESTNVSSNPTAVASATIGRVDSAVIPAIQSLSNTSVSASVVSGTLSGSGDNRSAPQPSYDKTASTAGLNGADKTSSQSNTSVSSATPKPPTPPTVPLGTASSKGAEPTHTTQAQPDQTTVNNPQPPGKSIESTHPPSNQSSASTQPQEQGRSAQPSTGIIPSQPATNPVITPSQAHPIQANLSSQAQQGNAITATQPQAGHATTLAQPQQGKTIAAPQPQAGRVAVPAQPQPQPRPIQANVSSQPQSAKTIVSSQPQPGYVIMPAQQPQPRPIQAHPSNHPQLGNVAGPVQPHPRPIQANLSSQPQPGNTILGRATAPGQPQLSQAMHSYQSQQGVSSQHQPGHLMVPAQPQSQLQANQLQPNQPQQSKPIVQSVQVTAAQPTNQTNQPQPGKPIVQSGQVNAPPPANPTNQSQQSKPIVQSIQVTASQPTNQTNQPQQSKPIVQSGQVTAPPPANPTNQSQQSKPIVQPGQVTAPPTANLTNQSQQSKPIVQSVQVTAAQPTNPSNQPQPGKPIVQSGQATAPPPANPTNQSQQSKPIVQYVQVTAPPPANPTNQSQPGKATGSSQPASGHVMVPAQSYAQTPPGQTPISNQPQQQGHIQPQSSYVSTPAQGQARNISAPTHYQPMHQPHIQHQSSHMMAPAHHPPPNQANASNQLRQVQSTPPQPQPQPQAHTGVVSAHLQQTTPQAKASAARPVPAKPEGKSSGLSAILAEYAMHSKQLQNAKSSSAAAVAVSSTNQSLSGVSPKEVRLPPSASTTTTPTALSIAPPVPVQLPSNASNQTRSSTGLPTSSTSAQAAYTTPAPITVHISIESAKLSHPTSTVSTPAPSSDKSSSGSVQGRHNQQQQQQASCQTPKPGPPITSQHAPTTQIAADSASKQESRKSVDAGSRPSAGSEPMNKPNPSTSSNNQEQAVQGTPVSGTGRPWKANDAAQQDRQTPSAEMTPLQAQSSKSGSSSTTYSNSKSEQASQQSTQSRSSPVDAVSGGRRTPQPHYNQSQQSQALSDSHNSKEKSLSRTVTSSKDASSNPPPSHSKEYSPAQQKDMTESSNTANRVASTPKGKSSVKPPKCKNCGEAHFTNQCDSLKCFTCQGTFKTVSNRREHYRWEHGRHLVGTDNSTANIDDSSIESGAPSPRRSQEQQSSSNFGEVNIVKHRHLQSGSSKNSVDSVSQSKADMDMNMMAVVGASKSSSQQITPSALVVLETGLVPYNDQEFCQNCLERGHVSVDCSVLECGICFEVFTSVARRVAHSFLQHRDIVKISDYCQPISPRVQQLSDSEKTMAVVVSSGRDDRLSAAALNGSKRSRSPGRDDLPYRADSKRLKALDISELEEVVKVQREQMRQMREDMKAQRQQMDNLQWDIEQHKQEMKQDREGTHAQRQVMKQQQDMINRQQEESRQVLAAFQEDADKITRRLLDVLHHRLGSGR